MKEITITDIKTTKKGRYALFCDIGFLFSVDDVTLYRYDIEIGKRIGEDVVENMRRDSDYNKAFLKALDYLAIRSHSEKELGDKLMRKFDEDTAQAILEKMREMEYLDDEAFAEKYFAELTERKGKSVREAQNRLRQKGIGREIIEQVCAGQQDDETPRIKELINKKYSAKLLEENGTAYVYNSLFRKGFSHGDISSALKEYDKDIED